MKILVTGGAGYVGSHCVEELCEAGEAVVVFDNLFFGHREAVHPKAAFVEGDLKDAEAVNRLFAAHQFDAVMHFASHTLVGESMEQPLLYIGENVTNALNLFRAMLDHNVKRFILSSTANLFDQPERMPIDENERIVPGSPYGESKNLIERQLYWLDKVSGLRYACLRYFNASGASPAGQRGEDHRRLETHLIPIVLQVALGQREKLIVNGNDYPTPDGTCVRDYIHVTDLAQAHILALRALDQGSRTYNLGNGNGYSILEVLQTAEAVTGRKINYEFGPRRPGDPAILIASSEKIKRELGWQPRFGALRDIVATAWEWHRTHPNGYNSKG
ncbi:MAG TPA: UDP-glucose 4-epimerase GalE [Anaerolineae bacterium]|nr:UDP-glucose 4-epimerase GalE [Anaerolineae bacterium]